MPSMQHAVGIEFLVVYKNNEKNVIEGEESFYAFEKEATGSQRSTHQKKLIDMVCDTWWGYIDAGYVEYFTIIPNTVWDWEGRSC